jgi:A/G-specific adenine glycosylase
MKRGNPIPDILIPSDAASLHFPKSLVHWHKHDNKRTMPWKGERDPYRIWLSEIILQQTRVEQGWAYYERFIVAYPNVRALATAQDTEVFKLWEGLGYYSRCRNLLKAARKIVTDHGGMVPADHAMILSLPGVGPYTAAAISSFAFGLPHAVVDGNVLRVLARYFGIRESVDEGPVRKSLGNLAQSLLYRQDPAAYNQAIMDFGATVCKPAAPRCSDCPMQQYCVAFQSSSQDILPVRTPKTARRLRWMDYVIPIVNHAIPLRERNGRDVWRHLYEPILIESSGQMDEPALLTHPLVGALSVGILPSDHELSAPFVQLLTHQQISGRFLIIQPTDIPEIPDGYRWVDLDELPSIPFPRHIRQFLDQHPLFSAS